MQTVSTNHQTGTFAGREGLTIFHQRWLPPGEPRAVIVLAHGIAEHSGRYAHVGAAFAAQGMALCALDHRGHGHSGGGRLQIDEFDEFADDLTTFIDLVRADFPGVPLFVYGHSMGSMIVLRTYLRAPDPPAAFPHINGIILSGTALRPAGANPLSKAAGTLAARVLPQARLVPPLSLAGISCDPAVQAAYRADELNTVGWLPLRLTSELLRTIDQVEAALPALRLPVLAVHGTEDTLVLPVSAEILRDRAGSSDLTVTLYEGLRHEVHNEPEQDRVLNDIAGWVAARLPA